MASGRTEQRSSKTSDKLQEDSCATRLDLVAGFRAAARVKAQVLQEQVLGAHLLSCPGPTWRVLTKSSSRVPSMHKDAVLYAQSKRQKEAKKRAADELTPASEGPELQRVVFKRTHIPICVFDDFTFECSRCEKPSSCCSRPL